jgi:hypothetical protein
LWAKVGVFWEIGQPDTVWRLQRLVDPLVEETELRVEAETVRIYLKAKDRRPIFLSDRLALDRSLFGPTVR